MRKSVTATSRSKAFCAASTRRTRVEQKGEQILRDKLKFPVRSLKARLSARHQWQVDFQRDIEGMLRAAITKQMEHALGLLEGELKNVWSRVHDESLQANFRARIARKQFGRGHPRISTSSVQAAVRADRVGDGREHGRRPDREAAGQDLFAETATWAKPAGRRRSRRVGCWRPSLAAHIATAAVADRHHRHPGGGDGHGVGTVMVVGKRAGSSTPIARRWSAKRTELDAVHRRPHPADHRRVLPETGAGVSTAGDVLQRAGGALPAGVGESVESLEKNFQKISAHLVSRPCSRS